VFAVFLLLAARSVQMSGYTTMLDNMTRLLVGHVRDVAISMIRRFVT
jgi:hypothetical protein